MLKLIAMPIFFFLLPVYGLLYGEGDTTSNVTMVTILDDWYDLKGTQTEPPGFVKPLLYVILAASSLSDIIFVILNRKDHARSAWLQVARVFNLAAAIAAAICGEFILAHVASNTLPPSSAVKKTAAFGSMISVLMILLIVPPGYELLAVLDVRTPNGD